MKEESAGIVPYRLDRGKRKYLLLRTRPLKGEFWEFPKGWIEKGETLLETAKREFSEETGIPDCEIVPGFQKVIRYFYKREGKLIAKTVTYFLGRVKTGRVAISDESVGFAWMDFEEAKSNMTIKNLRDLLVEAERFLEARPG